MPMQNSNPAMQTGGRTDISKMNPNVLLARFAQVNPMARQVIDSISGMGPEEAFRKFGYDYNQVRQDVYNQFGITI